ncbi:leucine-rich repeat domain-containing protein [Flavobacterium sp. N1994]|uniref:leucine-rich repeat domain-containing protein n=1 Tax=Flavobacterium sp. N1994 TaxID=2986827 RepID=UPI00222257D6|nr:leucine-rich repeat domain-containing protein [Flavobacterium sp. N1994]
MKKYYALFVITLLGFVGKAQIVNIPDANFKARLLAANAAINIASTQTPDDGGNVTSYNSVDTNNDGEIQVSEALAIKWLWLRSVSISDLTGIESFSNLQVLTCINDNLTNLNVSALTNLRRLNCTNNQIPSLNVSGLTNLQYVDCSDNQILSLNVIGLTNLQTLGCAHNQISSLDLNGLSNLQNLHCPNNHIPSLNLNGLTNLKTLGCYNNQLSSLDVSSLTNLEGLSCSDNQISSLDLSGLTNLTNLYCGNNQLSSLNVIGLTNLQILYCFNNQLTSLDLSSLTNLRELGCSNNQLSSINVSGLLNLNGFNCSNNQLSSLDVSGLTNLQILECSSNQLPSIDVSSLTNLTNFDCSNNQLPSIDVSSMTNLQILVCNGNQFSSLNVGDLTNLQVLYCLNNQLTSIDISGLTNIQQLNCSNNQLNTLFLKNGAIEVFLEFSNNPNLKYICADDNQVSDVQTKIVQYGYTNCHVNSYCSFTPGGDFYTIQGNNRYDSNANGCDVLDINLPSLNLAITDGTNTGTIIPDASGAYQYDIQAGTQTLTPTLENPTYFSISPTTVTVDFPTTSSPFVQDFCVTANGIHNDLEVVILPIGVARPGFDVNYKIIYKNKGTASQNGSVNLIFDDGVLDYVSAIPTLDSQATNSLSWNFSNLLPFETREITVVLNVNSPTETPAVNGGDILSYNATITNSTDETPLDNVSYLNQTVINSFDPNDKTCIEGTTITPSMVGQYVHYLVRFENNGTANAHNIVVKDIIDTTKFDVSSLVPLSGSASYTTRISNTNQVEFIFQNINLPFATGANTGYVAFKIKTLPTLVVGNTFSNSANIYFDYNFPIVTNTATTTIATLGTQDFDFGSVFTLSPVPAKNNLTITTKQDVVISSLSIYNTLGQLVQVITNPNDTIDVSGLQSGNYFVRMTSDKGSATGKFIKE